MGIEPTASAWKAEVLPLYDIRVTAGTSGGIRTHTLGILSPLSLPIGLHSHYASMIFKYQHIFYFIKSGSSNPSSAKHLILSKHGSQ